MPHVRIRPDTKNRLETALTSIQADRPEIKTVDDLQNYLLDVVNPKSLVKVIESDFKEVSQHLCLHNPSITKKDVERLSGALMTIAFYSARSSKDIHKANKLLESIIKSMEEEK